MVYESQSRIPSSLHSSLEAALVPKRHEINVELWWDYIIHSVWFHPIRGKSNLESKVLHGDVPKIRRKPNLLGYLALCSRLCSATTKCSLTAHVNISNAFLVLAHMTLIQLLQNANAQRAV